MKLYAVTMYRWGDREKHSYLLGVYSTKGKATKSAKKEKSNRGGKYFPECLEISLDKDFRKYYEIIISLEKHPKIEYLKSRF